MPHRELLDPANTTVLELYVQNHPGVMTHVCGLFTRRSFNVEGILCMPVDDGSRSRIWLLVKKDECIDQMIKQARKLEDVFDVTRHDDGHHVFNGISATF